MPRISEFIKELLAEPWHGTEFHAKLPERLQQLNAAQLEGIYQHLEKQVATSSFSIWSNANEKIMLQMKTLKDERVKIAEKERKKKEEKDLREQNKKSIKKAKAAEAIRVVEHIKEVARKKAEEEVLDEEAHRSSQEKLEIMRKVFDQEPLRNKYIAAGVLFWIVGIAIVSAVVTDGVILGPVIVFIFIITGGIFYKAYKLSFVKATVVPEAEIERRIEEKGAEKIAIAMENLKAKEEKFKERQRLEALEYAQIKEERKILKEIKAAEAAERARLEDIEHEKMMAAKAEEIRKRKMNKKDLTNKEIKSTFINDNNNNNDNDNDNSNNNNQEEKDVENSKKFDAIIENDNNSLGSESEEWIRERRLSDVSSITAFSADFINQLDTGSSFIFEKNDNNESNDKVIIDIKPIEEVKPETDNTKSSP